MMTDCVAEQESFLCSGPSLPILFILGNHPWFELLLVLQRYMPGLIIPYYMRYISIAPVTVTPTGVVAGAALSQGLIQRACVGTNMSLEYSYLDFYFYHVEAIGCCSRCVAAPDLSVRKQLEEGI
jgi:hypothetical protein